jgi:S-methylmethionine-dependent homocysteine/selenocysteine methylase
MLVDAQLPHVDLWLGETISSVSEAEAILDAIESVGAGKDVWLGLTPLEHLDQGRARLRSGAPVGDAVDALGSRVDALLLNCSTPEVMGPGLREMAERRDRLGLDVRLGAYANSFDAPQEDKPANDGFHGLREELTPEAYAAYTHEWISLGATIVGGCCGIGPEHIAAIDRDFEVVPPQP